MRAKVLLVLGVALVGIIGVGYGLLRRRVAEPQRNVILILLDTVRADRLGCLGSEAGLTPMIDKFAKEAVCFENAYAQAPWTLPSVASMFTSRLPHQHGAGGRLGAFRVLSDDAVTVAEVFKRAGAVTGAITNVFFLGEKFGVMQGFDIIDAMSPGNNILIRDAGATTDAALEWLTGHMDDRFFLLVHYFDPHLRYDPPMDFRLRFADPQDRSSKDHIFGSVQDMMEFRQGSLQLDGPTIRRLEKLHNAEIAHTDSEVGRLLVGITQRGLKGDTIVVITADHGEEFDDHGGFEHGHTLYDELLHVPLLIRAPGIRLEERNGKDMAGTRVTNTVRLIDVAPTLCGLAGVEQPDDARGKSLAPAWEGREIGNRPVLSEGNMWGPSGIAYREGRHKIIRLPGSDRTLLFDINTDPGEQTDLAKRERELVNKMLGRLYATFEELSGDSAFLGESPALSESELEQLRGLGYVR